MEQMVPEEVLSLVTWKNATLENLLVDLLTNDSTVLLSLLPPLTPSCIQGHL